MKKKTILITSIFLVSTIIQVLSNIITTRFFGASVQLDQFLVAVTLPTIFVTVIYGTLNDALLPLYGEKLVKDPDNEQEFFSTQITTLTLLSLIPLALLLVFSPVIMKALFVRGGQMDVYSLSTMFSVMVFAIPLSVFVTALGMRHYARKNYSRFPMAQLLGSIANLLIIIASYAFLGIWGLVFAFVLSIFVQLIYLLPLKFQPRLGDVKPTLALWLPLIIGVFALKSDSLIIRSFGSQMGQGYVVYLNIVSKIAQLSAGILTIGMQVVLFPNIVEKLAHKNISGAKTLVNKAKLISLALSISLAVFIYIFAPLAIKILFVGGRFNIDDYQKSVSLLPYFILPIIGWGVVSIFLQPLLALKKHLQLGILNIFVFVLAWQAANIISSISIPLAISAGLSVLLIGVAIGAEILWRYYLPRLIANES